MIRAAVPGGMSAAQERAEEPNATRSELLAALVRLAALQREAVDRLALQEAVEAAEAVRERADPRSVLALVARRLQVRAPCWLAQPDASALPALIADPAGRWAVLRGRNASEQWVVEWLDPQTGRWSEAVHDELRDCRFAAFRLTAPFRAGRSPTLRLVLDEVLAHKALLLEAAVGGLLLAVLGVFTSFFSMQVYDRVIPSGATQTLMVLTIGVLIAVALEFTAKGVRSRLYERLIDRVDQRLARTVYLRFLSVRIDQLPPSVGTLAGQLRGYESVRSFLVTLAGHMLVDAPFALLFALLIAAIAGPLALIPLVFLVFSLSHGLWQSRRVLALTRRSHAAANLKTGLLVETVEGAEIIKSGQGGWRMLNRWLASTDDSRDIDLQMRRLNDHAQHLAGLLQQLTYVSMVATGAWMATRGEITSGGLIACSILSGRVLTPVTQLGSQLISWGHTRAALSGLDAIWKLEDDHHGQERPVLLERIRGAYRLEQVTMQLQGKPALQVAQLALQPGEKVGVLGPVGAGKTTLLRLLAGLYKPTEGRVWLDDVDLAQLSRPLLAEYVGYLPQDGRLLSGSLRDNLILGLADPGDEAILSAARTTGLYESVLATHPRGLEQEIAEGGSGLSGGQRQLVNLTRVFLRAPRVWLLDEPTASLDRQLEQRLIGSLRAALQPEDMLVLVTHKPEMLALVDRLIVVANHQIVLDGARDAVLDRLQGAAANPPSTAGVPPAAATAASGPIVRATRRTLAGARS